MKIDFLTKPSVRQNFQKEYYSTTITDILLISDYIYYSLIRYSLRANFHYNQIQ
jgi:hypothetical protein